jgi:quercetin dioxygenase-like cupin family protein
MVEETTTEVNKYWKRIVVSDEERHELRPGGKGWSYIGPEACGALTIEAGIFEISPGADTGNTDLHSHSNEEFSYILSGKGWVFMEDTVHYFEAGDFIFVPSFAKHGWGNDGDESVKVLYYRPIKAKPEKMDSFDVRRFKVLEDS